MIITSLKNPIIKNVYKLLRKNNERKKQQLFIIDGFREIKEAQKAGLEIVNLIYCNKLNKKQKQIKSHNILEVDKKVFLHICYKEKPDGFLAVVRSKKCDKKDIKIKNEALILILEQIEKPGNLGAIIRTAYATGVNTIILNDNKVDINNPNVIRASEGKVFSLPIIYLSSIETKEWLKENNVKIVSTHIKQGKKYTEEKLKKSVAIVFGSEDKGLNKYWLKESDSIINIPMKKGINSLNLSVSVAVILFEIIRQRE